MTHEKQTLVQWYNELERISRLAKWPTCSDPDECFVAWEDGMTPADYLEMDMSYADDDEDT